MAGHNLSPRQKMINMMYLMLTAMLALNVSKEVLNAFATIDEGILKAVENTVAKNQSLWEDFETRKASQEKSEKVKKYFTIAKELRSKADEICEFILESKKEIVKTSEGADAEAITEDEVTVMDIKAKDKTEAPAQVMVGAEGRGGRGKELKKKIDELKSWLLNDIVDDDYEQLQESIESALFTGEIKHKDQVYDWVHGNFEHMPIAGVIAVLFSIENNVRNVETDVLNYLYGQIDVGTIKFNAIEAMAISNSNHVIRGNKYSARIFTAASDTSAKPLILIGDVKKDEEGKFDGFEGTPDTVPLGPGGKGI